MERFPTSQEQWICVSSKTLATQKTAELPHQEIIIKEYDVQRNVTRDVASLYIRSQHFKTITPILQKFNALSSGKIIQTEVKEVGIVTY